jgi:hypothetical protein
MARYIDADKLKNRMFNYYECVNENTGKDNYRGETLMNYEVADMIEDCIDNAPTEDVVPRSEVEGYIVNMNAYGLTAKRLAEENEQMKQAKQEAAKEIFEEIENKFHDDDFGDWVIDFMEYQELKKKYIGE